VLVFLAVGFPVTVVLAWAFELTPEGVKLTVNVPEGESIAPKTGRKLDYAILGGLALVGALLLGDRLMPETAATSTESAAATPLTAGAPAKATVPAANGGIAVLPFSNRSVREEDAYFADGIQDELLTQLAKISALRVISRTSVLGYRDTTKKIPEIARELGVAAVLEGAVQRAGDRVRINVQLIDGATDAHLWAENYDRELTAENLFDIQSDITEAIAAALKAVLTGDEKAGLAQSATQNVVAYEAYLRGKSLMEKRTGESLNASITELNRAVTLDPEFAQAHATLSRAYVLATYYADMEDEQALENAGIHAERAIALAPDLPDAMMAVANLKIQKNELKDALAIYEQIVARFPNESEAWRQMGLSLNSLHRPSEARNAFEKAAELDPLSVIVNINLAETHFSTGDDVSFERIIDKALSLSPDDANAQRLLSWLKFSLGDLDAAHRLLKDAEANGGPSLARDDLFISYFSCGMEAHAQRNADDPFERAIMGLVTGGIGEAIEIARAISVSDPVGGMLLAHFTGADDLSLEAARKWVQNADLTNDKADITVGELHQFAVLAAVLEAHGDPAASTIRRRLDRVMEGRTPRTLRLMEGRLGAAAWALDRNDIPSALVWLDAMNTDAQPWRFLTLYPAYVAVRDRPEIQARWKANQKVAAECRAAIEAQLADPPANWISR
jgi:TolB-like protein/cytochrome c-type biogenesis protein CcmH/NrfG